MRPIHEYLCDRYTYQRGLVVIQQSSNPVEMVNHGVFCPTTWSEEWWMGGAVIAFS
jgi:hypothetical protein